MFRAYAGVSVLVLGASGFIGSWVARALAAAGATVHAAVRDPAALDRVATSDAILAIRSDLREPGAVRDLVEIARPDVVFNLAGYGVDRAERDPAAMQALNAELVGHVCGVLAAAERATAWGGLRLVHVGSALEYGQWAGPLSEDVAAAPTTDYGRSKLAGTEHVLHFGRAGHPASVARLFNVYGPGEHPDRLLPTIERAARTASRVPLSSGTQSRDFTYVEDVAEGLLRLALEPMASGMVVHLATGRLTSVREFAETAADVLGLPRSALDFGAMPDRDVELHHGPVDIGRLRRILGWAPPTPLADGLRRSWEFAYA